MSKILNDLADKHPDKIDSIERDDTGWIVNLTDAWVECSDPMEASHMIFEDTVSECVIAFRSIRRVINDIRRGAKPYGPFRVSASWIDFAHGPGADSLYSMATELCGMITERDYILVPPNRLDLVLEIISVAESYQSGYHMDADDRITAATASRLIKRAKQWIANKENE